jgi:PAS domain S-box-containing protein
MGRLGLKGQVFLLLVLPVLIQIAALVSRQNELRTTYILFGCSAWLLIGCARFYLITIARIRIIKENTYRYANNLAGRPLSGARDELFEIDELLRKVYVRLESANDRYKACLSNTADVICVLHSNFNFSMANDAVQRLWQYDPYHIVGRCATDFMYPDDVQAFEQATRTAIETGVPANVNLRVVRRDGTLCWTGWTISWVASEKSFFAISKDVTQKHQLELMKTEFVNMVGHDLRTPLVSLTAFVDVLRAGEYGQLNERGMEMTNNSRASLSRLIRLVNDLLDLEKMEEGKFELELCILPVGEIVHDAVASVTAYAQQKKIEINCEGDLSCDIEVDPQRMVQVVQNLLSNAIKFSPIGSRIVVSVNSTQSELTLGVKDEGSGVPQDKVSYIFDRYRQLPNSEGTGLGLAICQAIIVEHHGSIGVENNEPKGSIFWFRIPLPAENSMMEVTNSGQNSTS